MEVLLDALIPRWLQVVRLQELLCADWLFLWDYAYHSTIVGAESRLLQSTQK